MSLLSDEERNQLEDDIEQQIGKNAFDAIEAAILAKLAAKELPPLPAYECGPHTGHAAVRTDESIKAYGHQAHAQGFAAGASAQLAEKPSGYLSQHNLEMLQQGYPQTIVMLEGAKRDTPLYTRREA